MTEGELAFDAAFAPGAPADARPLDPGRRYDVLVVGAGPAGLSAAIYLMRKNLDTGVLGASLGGQVALTAAIENYPGYRLIDGARLVERFREQVAASAPALALGVEATGAERRGEDLLVRAGDAAYAARALILATGSRPRMLDVPGGARLAGRGVADCAICDAPLYRGRVVGVVGGGNTGVEAAIDLARVAERVHLFQDLDRLTGDPVLQRHLLRMPQVQVHLGSRVTEVLGEERVRGVRVRDAGGGGEREVALDGVFVALGLVPNSEPFRALVPLGARGEIVVDAFCRTAAPGVFAAGDVTSVPYKQIVVAAGEGAKAALSAYDYLLRLGAGR